MKRGDTLYYNGDKVQFLYASMGHIFFLHNKILKSVPSNSLGNTLTVDPPMFDAEGYDAEGFNKEGFDRDGFNKKGYNRRGFDKRGFDKEGYNARGFDHKGFNRDGYDSEGYDHEGFNKWGFNYDGINKYGLTASAFEKYKPIILGFSPNTTKLYHPQLGEGTFIKFTYYPSGLIITVKFSSKEMTLSFPDSINRFLFFTEYDAISKRNQNNNSPETNVDITTSAPSKIDVVPSCDNCMIRKKEICTSVKRVLCEDYKPIFIIPPEEKENWPLYGDATAYRIGDYDRF